MRLKIILLFILLYGSGCYSIKQDIGAVKGQVFDDQTGQVIEGVRIERLEVVKDRSKLVQTPVFDQGLSDEDGEFSLASQHRVHLKTPFS